MELIELHGGALAALAFIFFGIVPIVTARVIGNQRLGDDQ